MTEACSSSPGSTHYHGCACHEAAWAEKLAAAEERAAEAEWLLLVHTAGSVKWQAAAMAAEERVRRLEEALRNAVEMIHDASGPLEYARANDWMRGQLLALNPPPEAEKKGGE